MKKQIAFLLAAVLLLSLAGCETAMPVHQPLAQPTESQSSTDDSVPTEQPLEFSAQYIRTNGGATQFPDVQIIDSVQALTDYYEKNDEAFDLERKAQVYSDTTIGFLDACDKYDDAFFADNYLIFVLLEEGSGSIRHEVTDVLQTADGEIAISIDTHVPSCFTCDMAQWHIILELDREVNVFAPQDVLVYLNGTPIWNDGVIEPPQLPSVFQHPPAGYIITPEGEAPLVLGGFSWFYYLGDDQWSSTLADASRPLSKGALKPVSIPAEHGESIQLYDPDTETYQPINTLGYLVKLDWEAAPTSVSFTCWPDTVWDDSTTSSAPVYSHADHTFYAYTGGYVYEITATWEDAGISYHGTANYYVYIQGGVVMPLESAHVHTVVSEAQTVDDPVTGYCGNTWTTIRSNGSSYTFCYDKSVTLTNIVINLDYDPGKTCRCMAEFSVDTEFGTDYQVNLTQGFVRCDKGQAELTQAQIDEIAAIFAWAKNQSPN